MYDAACENFTRHCATIVLVVVRRTMVGIPHKFLHMIETWVELDMNRLPHLARAKETIRELGSDVSFCLKTRLLHAPLRQNLLPPRCTP
jgi:hypothetical protein